MKYIVSINDKNYEVEVERGQAQILKTTKTIQLEAPAAPAAATAPIPSAQPAVDKPAEVVDGEPVKAPLPGTVLALKASEGSAVKKGQTLLILEAMKMENEIVAPRDGVLTRFTAGRGTAVNTGDILAVLK